MRRIWWLPSLLVVIGLVLSGCASKSNKKSAKLDPFAGTGSPYYSGKGPVPWGGGRYHVGKPYQVAGRWFKPKEQPGYDKKGPASWYGEAFNRRKTSNGEWFDMNRLTAAHPTLPLPSYVKVTNLENGREVIVRVNDRGPFVGPRIIDLSKRSAEVLDFKNKGKANVRVQYIGPAPLNDRGQHLMAMNRELQKGTSLKRMIAKANGNMDRGDVQIAAAEPETGVPEVATVAYTKPAKTMPKAAIGEDYYVQVGSYGDHNNAERVRAQLASVWPVQMMQLDGVNGTVYRVRIGPLNNDDDAKTALEHAISLGYSDARLIVAQSMQAALQ